MMAIEMCGGVYCPLSPRDPEYRLNSLLEQTGSDIVLVHYLTKRKFNENILSIDIDSILTENNFNLDRMSNVSMKFDDIAYIIFTSGSTGTPKAVSCSIN
jgi:non-ribosomal peptide synthetase component F